MQPAWIRAPKKGEREPNTGLTLYWLEQMAKEGRIKSLKLGNGRGGAVLYSMASILTALDKMAEEQNGEGGK